MAQAQTGMAETTEASLEQQVRSRIEALSYLPTTVSVAMKFVELGKDPDAEPGDYAKVISSDSSLSSKLLSLANSSWFGVRNKVTKPQTAVNLLGLGTVRTLAISYCLTGLHNDLRLAPEESRMLWSASLCKAVAAKQYALQFDKKMGEEAFTAALFQDFAMAILYAVAREPMGALLRDPQVSWQALLQKERDLFRLDHAEMGRVVAQKLELPDMFIDAVAFHHNREHLKGMLDRHVLADAVHVASLFPHCLDAWNAQDGEELRQFLAEHANAAEPAALLEGIQKEYNQIYAYFESGGKPQTNLTRLLETAAKEAADNTTRLVGTVHELLQQAASTGKEMYQILKQSNDLEEAVNKDPLTGALNRDGLNARAADLLGKFARYGVPMAVVYLDIDRFKGLNDTCGHACGDMALRQLVATVQGCIRQSDLLARVGGDEFLLLLSDCGEEDAARVVERILAKMAKEPISDGRGHSATATLSAGFLWISPLAQVDSLEHLVSAADQLMYQAKRAGGNQICKGAAA
jgi:diguanylate cyclase (GGDEF)-like protein